MSLDSLNRKVGLKLDKSGGEVTGDFSVQGINVLDLVPVGSILAYGGSADTGIFLICDGRAVSRSTYASLFAVIGTSHGSGDGSSTFNIPDYRGRFLRGVDGAAGNDPDKATRTAMASGGSTGNSVGSVQADELSGHTHTMAAYSPFAFVAGGATAPASGGTTTFSTNSTGGNETRPKNAYVNYIIRCR